tara:strand:- start:498 stop:1217 length:720 start_codon:yes stop_codon:yes gene_type:complete
VTNIKCVIAAGGLGTRLKDFRNNQTTKMLLDVAGIPMINRQITQLIKWGLSDFIVITNPDFELITKEVISKEFSDLDIEFAIQEEPLGISHALLQAQPFLSDEDVTLFVLGDNFLENNPIKKINFSQILSDKGCFIFTYEVPNPSDFGVAVIEENKVISIEEKPDNPKSNKAIIGVYIYDNTLIDKIQTLEPSERGEYEITDLNNLYIKEGSCMSEEIIGWWIDAGTPDRIEELESKLV